jgi:hypothetical protein
MGTTPTPRAEDAYRQTLAITPELDAELPRRHLLGRLAHGGELSAEHGVVGPAGHERGDGGGEDREELDLRHRAPRGAT